MGNEIEFEQLNYNTNDKLIKGKKVKLLDLEKNSYNFDSAIIDFSKNQIIADNVNINFNKGIFLTAAGSIWWGLIGVIYFKYIAFAGHIEVVIHRSLWTTVMLVITSILFSKINNIKKVLRNKKNLIILFFSGILIFTNWAVWIYAVSTDRVIDASFGYFIMPIISIFLGYFFFKEILTFKSKISISIVIFSILYLLLSNFNIINYFWYGLYLIYFIKGSKKNRDNLYSFNNYYKIYLSFILLIYFNPYSYLNNNNAIGYNINNINNDLKNICFTAGLLIFLELYDYNNYLSQMKEIKYLKKKIKKLIDDKEQVQNNN